MVVAGGVGSVCVYESTAFIEIIEQGTGTGTGKGKGEKGHGTRDNGRGTGLGRCGEPQTLATRRMRNSAFALRFGPASCIKQTVHFKINSKINSSSQNANTALRISVCEREI